MALKDTLITAGITVAGATLAGVLTYGLYGHLRDKGWSTWKSGAVTGLTGGCLAVGVGLIGAKVGVFSGIGQLPRAYPTPLRLVPKQVAQATLRGICAGCKVA